jgi:hypothetical protein
MYRMNFICYTQALSLNTAYVFYVLQNEIYYEG